MKKVLVWEVKQLAIRNKINKNIINLLFMFQYSQ